jgi:ATP-dependent protease ClpP protease subunit
MRKRDREEETFSGEGGKRARYVKDLRYRIDGREIYTIGDEVHFTCDVNSKSIETIIKEITINLFEFYKSKAPTVAYNLKYIIDSPGGSITDVLKFVDFISITRRKYSGLKYTSIITGRAASAGTIMAIVADEKHMTSNAVAMIHELSTGTGRQTYTQRQSHNKFIDDLDNKLMEIYMKNKLGDKSEEHIRDLMKRETWFTAEEYKELGFVEKIL